MKNLLLLIAIFWMLLVGISHAQDCEPLSPSNAEDIDEQFKGQIEGEISGLVGRLAGANADVNGEYRRLRTDRLNEYPDSHQLYVWERVLYLACLRSDIDINRLFELWINGPPEEQARTWLKGCPGDLIVGTMQPLAPGGPHQPWNLEFNLREGTNRFSKSDGANVTGTLHARCEGDFFRASLTNQSHGAIYNCEGKVSGNKLTGFCQPQGSTEDPINANFSLLVL